MISLDGVIQGPGGPKEDPSNGFKYGGWVAPLSDDVYNNVVKQELTPADYLLGRKTFQIWAGYWPQHGDFWPGINTGMKYVLSKKLKKSDKLVTGWQNSAVVRTVADIKKIKQSKGADLHVWGSSELIHLLLKNDLVDELHLKIHPLILGKGKKLFDNSSLAAAYALTDSLVTPKGVIIATYKRDGKVKTGNAGAQ